VFLPFIKKTLTPYSAIETHVACFASLFSILLESGILDGDG
jgi:hypothetical protein